MTIRLPPVTLIWVFDGPDRHHGHIGTLEERSDLACGKRVLPVTTAIMRHWGRLTWQIGNTDPDLLIAATVLEHDLVVATRNIRPFEPTGAKLFNPYEA